MLKNILQKGLHTCFIFICFSLCTLSNLLSAHAQTASGILSPGDAVVTGFSLINKQASHQSKDVIDLNGPSVRILSLPTPSSFGLIEQQKHFTVKARDVGQVFGVTIDNDSSPNMYVAATAAYGLAIFQSAKGRIQHGLPGAQFVPGLFGPIDQGGGPTSIWRIDGKTGKVSLFANVVYQGIENTPAALGGLAFDPKTQQLFVANRTTGMIHRFSLDGIDHGVYDHGDTGRSATGQQSIPFDASTLVNIKNHNFDTKNPNTWGFAPIERRVFAVTAHKDRLYYSVSGSQIWSVGIASDGNFANDSRLEVDSPALKSDVEISSIAFDDQGFMYAAERGFPTGDSDFIKVAEREQSRVIRFTPKNKEDSSQGFWISPGEEYAIGIRPEYQNANGGVDLTCAKTIWSTGDSLINSNGESNSPTINGLQGNAVNAVKPENMPPEKSWFINYYDAQTNVNAHGYMGAIVIWKVCSEATTASSTPPLTSTSIPSLTSSIHLPNQPSLPSDLSEPSTPIPGVDCPNGNCGPIPPPGCPSCCQWACPWGWGGPWGWGPGLGPWGPGIDPWGWGPGLGPWGPGFGPWGWGPGLGPWGPGLGPWGWGPGLGPWGPGLGPWGWGPGLGPWGPGLGPWGWGPGFGPWWWLGPWWLGPVFDPWWWMIDPCIPICPPILPFHWCPGIVINGHCFAPVWPIVVIKNFIKIQTAPITNCKPNEHLINGKCIPSVTCKPHEHLINGKCVPTINCNANEHLVNGKCVPNITCQSYERLVDGKCVPITTCKPHEHLVNGKCIPDITCKPHERLVNGKCVPAITCKPYEHLVNGKCVPNITCKPYERLVNGKCVPTITCKSYERLVNGKCVPTITCKPYERLVNGKCVPTITCKPYERLVNGKCVPTIACKPYERLVNGKCVPTIICKPHERLVNGKCIPTITCKPYERLVNGKCVPTVTCKPYERLVNGKCVPNITCKPYERLVNGKCVPVTQCKPNERLIHGQCIPIVKCKSNEHLVNGKCVPNISCKSYERLVNGKCVPITQCKPNERLVHGKCVPTTKCKSNERLVNGKCVSITQPTTCKKGEVLINGRCISSFNIQQIKHINLQVTPTNRQ